MESPHHDKNTNLCVCVKLLGGTHCREAVCVLVAVSLIDMLMQSFSPLHSFILPIKANA